MFMKKVNVSVFKYVFNLILFNKSILETISATRHALFQSIKYLGGGELLFLTFYKSYAKLKKNFFSINFLRIYFENYF